MNIDVLVNSRNNNSRITYASALAGYGYEVAETPSFEDATAMVNTSGSPRNIVIDLKLALNDAGEFIDYIRQTIGREDVRIIVIGGNVEEEHAVENVGADMFLYRPVQLGELVHYVQ